MTWRSFVCVRALKGKLRKIGLVRRDIPLEIIYSRTPLPSAITNEPPVIENNRCPRVMPSKDRTLASPSIYEPVIRTSTLTRMERYSVPFFDDTTTRQSAGAVSLASLRVIHIFMQNYTPDHIHPRFASSSKAAVSFSLLSVPFFRVRALFVFSSDSRAPQKIHYGITARSKLIVSFCANSDIGNRILPAQSKNHNGELETITLWK